MMLYALMYYAAAIVFIAGLGHRLWAYATTPAPLRIPVTPAPATHSGVVVRLLREAVLFGSLFKANKWTWLFGWAFHAALLIVLLRHLRYFVEPVWTWVALIQPFGPYAGLVMVAALVALWARRVLVARVRAVSGPSDHLVLALLLGLGASGLVMRFVVHTDIVAVKAFALGLVYVDWRPLPADLALLAHLSLAALLLLVFPFSKLLHGVALFFNPTRNQPDDAREARYAPRTRAQERSAAGGLRAA